MNTSALVASSQYQSTIYLNDRPYFVLDIGEGSCIIVLVDDVQRWVEQTACMPLINRFIVVDVSKMLTEVDDKNEAQISRILTNDIHLLIDVFWLEEVEVQSHINSIDISAIQKLTVVREHCRSTLENESP